MAKKTTTQKKKVSLGFKPQAVTKRLIQVLPERARDVVVKRYGLGKNVKKLTLEAIGKQYDITRERVRQIENHALATIRKSSSYEKEAKAFDELEGLITSLGVIVPEEEFLSLVSREATVRNHVHFLLVLGSVFVREKEDSEFKHRWLVDDVLAHKVKEVLRRLYSSLSDNELVPESRMIDTFLHYIKDVAEQYRNEEIVRRWFSLSKQIDRNPFGEWGRATSSNVNLKGVRDYAYLVIRQHGSPMHFTEVAKQISDFFDKKAHVATTHNELIKDARFVLVGRGLYALTEWGYMTGVVKDVIRDILEKNGPLPREEIIDKVLKERYVKGNTVIVNLQNSDHFKRMSDGRYALL